MQNLEMRGQGMTLEVKAVKNAPALVDKKYSNKI
jgi:hypothetical protein